MVPGCSEYGGEEECTARILRRALGKAVLNKSIVHTMS